MEISNKPSVFSVISLLIRIRSYVSSDTFTGFPSARLHLLISLSSILTEKCCSYCVISFLPALNTFSVSFAYTVRSITVSIAKISSFPTETSFFGCASDLFCMASATPTAATAHSTTTARIHIFLYLFWFFTVISSFLFCLLP